MLVWKWGVVGRVRHPGKEKQVDRSQVATPVTSLAEMWTHFVLL